MKAGLDGRMTFQQYAASKFPGANKKMLAKETKALKQKFAATGVITCESWHGAAQLIGAQDVTVTAAHNRAHAS